MAAHGEEAAEPGPPGGGGPIVRPTGRWWRVIGAITLTIAIVGLLVLLLWPVSDAIAAHDVRHVPRTQWAEKLRAATDAARGRIIQVIAGLLATGGFVYTARNFTLARQQSELNRKTLELATRQAAEQNEAGRRTLEQTEAAQMTDRFARAIDQLGSDAVDVRLGAVYSLERIARDSVRDHPAVMDVLAAFARRRSAERTDDGARPGRRPEEVPQDLQAAMTVLARRDAAADAGPLRLRGARLARVELPGARLAGADLTGADLSGARLTGADLSGADLSAADLTGTRLGEAGLSGARCARARFGAAVLTGADLSGADLREADLAGADLTGARPAGIVATGARLRAAVLAGAELPRADLSGADLADVDLTGADLTGAVLTRADLSGAKAGRSRLAGARLDEAVAGGADLTEADLSGADLRDANLSGATLAGARLDGVDLSRVKLAGLDLRDAVAVDGAVLPAGWLRDAASGRIARDLR